MREQAKCYVLARRGELDMNELGKFTHALMSLNKMLKDKLDGERGDDQLNTLDDFVQALKDNQVGS
jgi:hypothetical protein